MGESELYRVRYHEKSDHSVFDAQRSVLVDAPNKGLAKAYVKKNVDGFIDFMTGHDFKKCVSTVTYHES